MYVNLIVYDWNLLRQLTYILDNKIIRLNIRKLTPKKKKEKYKEISLNKRQQIHKMYLIDYNKKLK